MTEPVPVLHLLGAMRQGSSLPLIVESDEGRYIVKPMGGGGGVISGVVEWISLRLAESLGLPVVTPSLLSITADLSTQAEDPEVREILERSVGLNLATAYQSNWEEWQQDRLASIPQTLRDDIFLFDLLLLNVDRTLHNPNLALASGKLVCFDYASCLAVCEAVTSSAQNELDSLRQLRVHPFFRAGISCHDFMGRIRSFPSANLNEIVESIPASWILSLGSSLSGEHKRGEIGVCLSQLLTRAAFLIRRWDKLRTLKPVSADERKEQALRNRAAFRERWEDERRRGPRGQAH